MARATARPRSSLGSESERLAAEYLRSRGYFILEKNFRCPGGEIDIIGLDGSTLVFVEVKARGSEARGGPEEAVTREKQSRVRKAAQVYLSYSGRVFRRIRFDVIALRKAGKNTDIIHLKAAFSQT